MFLIRADCSAPLQLPRMENQSWFVAATIVGREREAEARLSRFETFLPLTRVNRIVCRRTDQLEQALFPGYFFVRCQLERRPLKRDHFRGLVGLGGPGIGEPLTVDPEAVSELMSLVDARRVFRQPELKPGTPVEITGGPESYWGRRGLYECRRSDERVIVLLTALVPFRVELSRAEIRPLEVV